MENQENGQTPSQGETTPDVAMHARNGAAGYTVLRIVLGINIAAHGFSRLLTGPGKFAGQLSKQFGTTLLPTAFITAFGYGLPWIEGTLGVMILLGILTWPALVAGALLIAVLTFGSCLIQDWNAAGVQLLYAVVYALLLASCRYNTISVDALLVRRRPNQPIPRA